MKRKTIKAVLNKKFEDWASSIEDSVVQQRVRQGSIITGGSITSMLLDENVNDFDVYLRDIETCKMVAEYYVKKFGDPSIKVLEQASTLPDTPNRIKVMVKSVGVAAKDVNGNYQLFEQDPDPEAQAAYEYVEAVAQAAKKADQPPLNPDGTPQRYRPTFLSSNAITLSDKIQVVIRFYGEPDQIHNNYDFVHCTCYWTSWNNCLVLPSDALECILARELRYEGSLYPLCSIIRTRKFIERGWTINAGQYLKMAMQLNALNLENPSVLEEQLTGVDTVYFFALLDMLKARDLQCIDTCYLMEVVDKIF